MKGATKMHRYMRYYYAAVGAILCTIMYFWYSMSDLPAGWVQVIGYAVAMLLFGFADWLGSKINANLP